MSVAPDGRIDVVWNDTRATAPPTISEVYYAYSTDAVRATSRPGLPVSPSVRLDGGTPGAEQDRRLLSTWSRDEADCAGLAWSATFNGEQDVYFLRGRGLQHQRVCTIRPTFRWDDEPRCQRQRHPRRVRGRTATTTACPDESRHRRWGAARTATGIRFTRRVRHLASGAPRTATADGSARLV